MNETNIPDIMDELFADGDGATESATFAQDISGITEDMNLYRWGEGRNRILSQYISMTLEASGRYEIETWSYEEISKYLHSLLPDYKKSAWDSLFSTYAKAIAYYSPYIDDESKIRTYKNHGIVSYIKISDGYFVIYDDGNRLVPDICSTAPNRIESIQYVKMTKKALLSAPHCPLFMQWLSDRFPSTTMRRHFVSLLGMMIYTSRVRKPVIIDKAMVLISPGRDGKDTIFGILKRFMAKQNFKQDSLLSNFSTLGSIGGITIFNEPATHSKVACDDMKAMISSESRSINIKYEALHEMPNTSRVIITANGDIPAMSKTILGGDKAMKNRVVRYLMTGRLDDPDAAPDDAHWVDAITNEGRDIMAFIFRSFLTALNNGTFDEINSQNPIINPGLYQPSISSDDPHEAIISQIEITRDAADRVTSGEINRFLQIHFPQNPNRGGKYSRLICGWLIAAGAIKTGSGQNRVSYIGCKWSDPSLLSIVDLL